MDELRPLADDWRGYRRSFEALQAVGAAVPALGAVVTARRLAAAIQGEEGRRRLYQVITDVRTDHAEEIDAFFAEHPELLSHLNNDSG
jgi:hypothetical protein